MTTTVAELRQPQQGAVAPMKPKDKIAQLLDRKKGEIAKMLPKHLNAERLLKVAQIAATTTPALLECEIPTLVGAIGQCAQMGLEPNTVLGHAYLVPFNVKRKDNNGREYWAKSVQVVIGYKGLIDLARRSGQIVSIAAHEVCENDKFDLVYGLDEKLTHIPSLGERGGIIGFYAVAKLKDGGHCFEFMSLHQVKEIMIGTQSKGKYGPWKDNFVEMGRKTVIRRLAKYLPLSIEFQTAAALDGMAESGKDQKLETVDGEFAFLPDDAPAAYDAETGEIHGGVIEHDPSPAMQPAAAPQQQPEPVAAASPAAQPAPEPAAAPSRQQSTPPAFNVEAFAQSLRACKDIETLDVKADEVNGLVRDGVITDDQADELFKVYRHAKASLQGQGDLIGGGHQAAAASPAPAQAQQTTRRRTSSAGTAPE